MLNVDLYVALGFWQVSVVITAIAQTVNQEIELCHRKKLLVILSLIGVWFISYDHLQSAIPPLGFLFGTLLLVQQTTQNFLNRHLQSVHYSLPVFYSTAEGLVTYAFVLVSSKLVTNKPYDLQIQTASLALAGALMDCLA